MRIKPYSTRHFVFNTVLIAIPWLSLTFIDRKSFKRYYPTGIFIIIFEFFNHMYGHKRHWWKFYGKKRRFITDELPFTVGPYMPLSLWILKYTFGNFKKFVLVNLIVDGLFAFVWINLFKKWKIIRLNKLNHIQFFVYLHYKAYLLYGFQIMIEKMRNRPF